MRGLSSLRRARFYSGETDNGSRAPTDKLPAWPPSVLRDRTNSSTPLSPLCRSPRNPRQCTSDPGAQTQHLPRPETIDSYGFQDGHVLHPAASSNLLVVGIQDYSPSSRLRNSSSSSSSIPATLETWVEINPHSCSVISVSRDAHHIHLGMAKGLLRTATPLQRLGIKPQPTHLWTCS